jgi:hypothetical protein
MNRGDSCMYWNFFKKTSDEQYDQIRVSFEVDPIAPSQPVEFYRLIYDKDYSIIDKALSKEELYPLLYDCIVDAFEHWKLKISELKNQYPYLDAAQMKLRDYEESYGHFEFEGF